MIFLTFPSGTVRLFLRGGLTAVLFVGAAAHAEPYLAVANGLKCVQCHVNPTGGGLRSSYGDLFAQYQLAMTKLDTGGTDNWTGDINRYLRVGGDLRYEFTATSGPNTKTSDSFEMEQTRIYGEAQVIPDRLLVYVDEQVAPNSALSREAYVLYWSKSHYWYIKAGQMYLPFGWRLQDQTAFVQTLTGINMTNPDQALEAGFLYGPWDIQLNVSNGAGGGASTTSGKRYTWQSSFVQSWWRLGVAASDSDVSGGRRQDYGVFAGLHTGPIAWLFQYEQIENRGLLAFGVPRRATAGLLEANYMPWRGNNFKLTYEPYDPDANIMNNGQDRWSFVYELTPIQFVQLRLGVRKNQGIPQAAIQNQVQSFVELHAFF